MYRTNHQRTSSESEILVWGNNQNNLLSASSNKLISTPQAITIPFQIAEITASEKHVSFLTNLGEVFSFGSNLDGRLGIGSNYSHQYKTNIENPVKVQFPSSLKAIKIQSGFSHVCAIAQDDSVYAWGLGEYGALGTGQFRSKNSPGRMLVRDGVIDIACGAMHTGLLMSNGQVYMCGSNQYGELGINKPEKISTPILLNFNQNVKQIACGVFYTLLLSQTGQVYGMGNNKYGQLGIGSRNNQFTPTLVQNLAGIVSISAGYHSAALDYYGNLFIWGSGSFGEFLRPKKFSTGVSLKQVSIRGFFGMAIGQNKIFVWGNNTYGQLGIGSFEALKEPTELKSLRGTRINTFACGVNFNFLVLGDANSNSLRDRSRSKQKEIQKQIYERPKQKERSTLVQRDLDILHSRKNPQYVSYNEDLHRDRQQYIVRNRRSLDKDISIRSPRVFMENSNVSRQRERQRQRETNRPVFQDRDSARDRDRFSSRAGFKNYEELFNTLSLDYEELLKKYKTIEVQLTDRQRSPMKKIQGQSIQIPDQATLHMNSLLKVEATQLNEEIAILRDELRITLRKLTETQIQRDTLRNQKELKLNNFESSIAQTKEANATSLNQIQSQYKHLLEKKDLLLENINQNHERECQQYDKIIRGLKQEVSFLHQKNKSLENSKKFELQNLQAQRIRRSRNRQQQTTHQIQNKLTEIKELNNRLNALSLQNNSLVGRIKQMSIEKQDLENLVMLKDRQFSQISKDKEELLKILGSLQGDKADLLQKNKDNLILVEHGKALQAKLSKCQQQLKQFRVKNSYEKETVRKYEQDIRALTDLKEKLNYQLSIQYEINKDEKSRNMQYQSEFEKLKNVKKELSIKTVQLQDITQAFKKYQKKMESTADGQEHVIKQLKKELKEKQNQIQTTHESKNQQIKSILEKKRIVERQLISKEEDSNAFREKCQYQEQEIGQLNQQYKTLHRKYLSRGDEVDKQRQEKEQIIEELGNTKRQITRYKLQKEQMAKLRDQQIQNKKQVQRKLAFAHDQIKETREELKTAEQKISNLQRQNSLVKTQMTEVRNVYEEQQRINDELSAANKQFAENQTEFTNRISQLENKLYELECENKSYVPRYEALLQRNKEVDQRNKELSDMVNRAIQIQAESYKTNILKDIQIDTNEIIQQVKQQQEFTKGDRRKKKIQQTKQNVDTPQLPSKLEEQEPQLQPYSRLAKERITQHKKKVSDSARKLASILDMDSASRAKSTRRAGNQKDHSYNLEDFERINSKMDNLQTQKDQFITKINSFAEKLKIL